eukprot:246397_1
MAQIEPDRSPDTPTFKWKPRQRNLKSHTYQNVHSQSVSRHPLEKTVSISNKRKNKFEHDPLSTDYASKDESSDPLAASGVSAVDLDPLTAALISRRKESEEKETTEPEVKQRFQPWNFKRRAILSKYTTKQRIPVILDSTQDEDASSLDIPVNPPKAAVTLVKKRKKNQNTQNVSQKEFLLEMDGLRQRLTSCWARGQRQQALKIALMCGKMLETVSVPEFYPSMFVMCVDVLETFGKLVHTQIKDQYQNPEDYQNEEAFYFPNATDRAKDVCWNWFHKSGCIRDLVPRLYIEMSLLPCYRFITDSTQITEVMRRISHTIRGVGNPLVASYARAFLASKGREACPETYQDVLCETYGDFLTVFREIEKLKFSGVPQVVSRSMSPSAYADLFQPALSWLVRHIGAGNTEEVFFALIQQARACWNNASVLVHVLGAFDARFVSKHARSIAQLIRQAEESSTPKALLYRAFGRAVVEAPPSQEMCLPILNEVWKVVKKLTDPELYMNVAEVFVEFVLQNFPGKECNTLLKDILNHVSSPDAQKKVQKQIHSVTLSVMKYRTDFDVLFEMDNFLPVVDLLDREMKQSVSKTMLDSFARHARPTADPVLVNALFDVARLLHDSLDSLAIEDERAQVANLIIQFIDKLDFGNDLEQQLNIYNDARRSFTNLDRVTEALVVRVAGLVMKAHKYMKGRHSRKTLAFVKACIAYCHITIPSLESMSSRVRLFLHCAQIGLMNGLVIQSEGMLEAILRVFEESEESTSEPSRLCLETDLLQSFLSTLLLISGHPEDGPFFLVERFIEILIDHKAWDASSKIRLFFDVLSLLSAYGQTTFQYRIPGITPNDKMYGCSDEYLRKLEKLFQISIDSVLHFLGAVQTSSPKEHTMLSLAFANSLVTCLEMNVHSATLIVRLNQGNDTSSVEANRFRAQTYEFIRSQEDEWYQNILKKLDT